jgi:hypothetical protein
LIARYLHGATGPHHAERHLGTGSLGGGVPRRLRVESERRGQELASGPVGTTTLTGADLYLAPVAAKESPAAAPQALPEERGSLGVLRTWGVAPPTEIDGIPTSRE